MAINILENFKKDEGALMHYTRGRDELTISGISTILYQMGQPKFQGIEGNLDALAAQASWSAGYFQALRDVFNFKELYLMDKDPNGPQTALSKLPKFGAGDKVVQDGSITEKELREHLNGK